MTAAIPHPMAYRSADFAGRCSRLDPFDDALEDLRISGNVLLHQTFRPPCSVSVPDEVTLRNALQIDSDAQVMPFHWVRAGEFELRHGTQTRVTVKRHEFAICLDGHAHEMGFVGQSEPIDFIDLLNGQSVEPFKAADEPCGELVCGVFLMRAQPVNPLFASLPSVIKVSTDPTQVGSALSDAAGVLAREVDRGAKRSFSAARMSEVLCAEAIRSFHQSTAVLPSGWITGWRDPKVSSALHAFHAAPQMAWTIEDLAGVALISPSRFSARFRKVTGTSVMNYVWRWRINLACKLLRDTSLPVDQIAPRAGYESVSAFCRAFRIHLGVAPARWRREVSTPVRP